MKVVVFFLIFLFQTGITFAQSTASTSDIPSLNVNSSVTNRPLDPGTYISPIDYQMRLNSFIPNDFKYAEPTFTNGYLFFASGRKSALMKLNYNLFLRTMYFIDQSKDTLILYPTPDLKYIVTDRRLYYHDVLTGIYEVRGGVRDLVKLGKQKVFRQTEVEAMVGERSYSANYATETAMYVEYTPHDHKQAKQKILFLKENYYALINETDNLETANKKGFFRTFPEFQDELKAFLKQQNREKTPINFSDEKDLVRFLDYCNSLKASKKD